MDEAGSTSRRCTKCGRVSVGRDIARDFYPRRDGSGGGYRPWCKACSKRDSALRGKKVNFRHDLDGPPLSREEIQERIAMVREEKQRAEELARERLYEAVEDREREFLMRILGFRSPSLPRLKGYG